MPASEKIPAIEAVVFDVGETLVNENRAWTEEAERVGVAPFTLFGILGSLAERGVHHREVWRILGKPMPDRPVVIRPDDLYPDARFKLRASASAWRGTSLRERKGS